MGIPREHIKQNDRSQFKWTYEIQLDLELIVCCNKQHEKEFKVLPNISIYHGATFTKPHLISKDNLLNKNLENILKLFNINGYDGDLFPHSLLRASQLNINQTNAHL